MKNTLSPCNISPPEGIGSPEAVSDWLSGPGSLQGPFDQRVVYYARKSINRPAGHTRLPGAAGAEDG